MSQPNPPVDPIPTNASMDEAALRNQVFKKYAFEDQRNFYRRTHEKDARAHSEVNAMRALMLLIAGFCAALATFIAQVGLGGGSFCAPEQDTIPGICAQIRHFGNLLVIAAVVLPAVASVFGSLADLYQWKRTSNLYDTAYNVLDYTEQFSPADHEQDPEEYRKSLDAFADRVLNIMEQEQGQWGQNIPTVEEIDKFIREQREKTEKRTPKPD